MKHKIKIGENEYVGKVKKHGNDSWVCKTYVKRFGLLIKVYHKIYLRSLSNTDSREMCWNTAYEYEKTNIQ